MAKDDKPKLDKPVLIPAEDKQSDKRNEISNTLKPARPAPQPSPEKGSGDSKDGST